LQVLDNLQRRDPTRFLLVRDRINALTWRGKARMKMGRYAEAETDLAACRQIAPKLPPETSRNRDIRECAECFEASGDLARTSKAGKPVELRHYTEALRHWRVMKSRGQRSSHIDMLIARLEARVREAGAQP
jgi:hypothetical protein